MIRRCLPIPQKIYPITKRLKTPEEVEKYFPGLLSFVDSTEQPIPRLVDKDRRKIYYSGKKKRQILSRINSGLTNIVVILFIKQIIRKDEGMIIYSIYKKNHPVTPIRGCYCS